MRTQNTPIDPILSSSDSSGNVETLLSGAKLSAAQSAAHRQASARYRWKNEDDLREKARIRMRAHRQSVKDKQDLHKDSSDKKLRANATYCEKHGKMLAFKQRIRRQNAFVRKHGQQAFSDRIARQQAAEDTAWYKKIAEERAALEARAAARKEARENITKTGK